MKALFAICLLMPFVPAHAVVARLDDSTSPRTLVRTPLSRAQSADGRIVQVPFGRVDYRLGTAPYVGQHARIFYVIPLGVSGLRSPDGLRVQWQSSGTFASGSGRAGDRVPVWSGIVRGPWIEASFELTWTLDANAWRLPAGMPLRFESYFEIETLP